MGLDVTAYSRLEYVRELELGGDWDSDVEVNLENDPGFEDRLDGLPEGIYRPTAETQEFYFRAGSHGEYNEWRATLARLALGVDPQTVWRRPARFRDSPFFELILFSDNRGAIGPETAARLLDDFRTHRDEIVRKAATVLPNEPGWPSREWFADLYDQWLKAFGGAASHGVVVFS